MPSTSPITTSALGSSLDSNPPTTPFSTTAASPVAIKKSDVAVLKIIASTEDFLSLAIKKSTSITMPATSKKYGNIFPLRCLLYPYLTSKIAAFQ